MALIYEYNFPPSGGDDTNTIQGAIDFLRGSSEEGTLFIFRFFSLPYWVSNIRIPSNFTLIGNGITIKQLAGKFDLPIFSIEHVWDTRIEGFNFDGNKYQKDHVTDLSNAISIVDCENIELDNLTFKDVVLSCVSISRDEPEECRNIIINNCISENSGLFIEGYEIAGSFVSVNHSNNISICNSIVNNCFGIGISLKYANNVTIDNLVIDTNGQEDGILGKVCSRLTVQNCIIRNMFSFPIHLIGVSEFNIINSVVEYTEGFEVNPSKNHGIMISYNDDLTSPPNIISSNGQIQNFKGSVLKPSIDYNDIFIKGAENINVTSCNIAQGITLSRFDPEIGSSNISIQTSSIGNVNIYSVTKVLIDLSTCEDLLMEDSIAQISPEEIWLRNSTFSNIRMYGSKNIQIENSTYSNIININSTFYCLNNRKGLDLYYEGYPLEGAVVFTIPSVEPPDDPGIFFGTMAVDISKVSEQYDNFISELFYIRSQKISIDWLLSKIATIFGPTGVPYYSMFIRNENINIGLGEGFMVRLTLKLGFDKV